MASTRGLAFWATGTATGPVGPGTVLENLKCTGTGTGRTSNFKFVYYTATGRNIGYYVYVTVCVPLW